MEPPPPARLATLVALLAVPVLAEEAVWPHFAHPNWSPQGDLIALDCGPGGELDLCLYEVDSGRVERLTETPDMQEAVPVFSRDARKLSFTRERAGLWYLSVLDLDTGEITELIELTVKHASSSSWSPDGDRLAFDMLNDEGDFDIYSIHLDGSDLRLLIGGPGSQRFPTYSRDGMRIAYSHIVEGAGDLMVAARDGSQARRVTTHPADEGVPIWSPDGERLSFYRNLDGNFEVFLTDLEGNEERLTDNPAFDIFATFAPDGRSLIFESTRDRDPTSFAKGADLYELDLEGRRVVRLTEPSDFPSAIGGPVPRGR